MTDVRTLLRREESYAIHALLYAANNPGSNAASMAADLEMPPAFLAKVLRRLVESGFLDSRPGRKGGVTLRGRPEDISLLEVLEAVSGPIMLDTCQLRQTCATKRRTGSCRLNLVWMRTTASVRELFRNVHLDELMEPQVLVAG